MRPIPALPPELSAHATACPECDLILQDVRVPAGSESRCPRCDHVLREGRPNSVMHALLLSAAGLLLIGPAIGMPLLSLSVSGLRQEASLAQAILAMADNGQWEVALIVALCAVIAPLLNLWLLFAVAVALQWRSQTRWLPLLMRLNHFIREWAMLEVFLMGVLVSIVKLKDIAELLPGVGLYCFALLMLCGLLLNTVIDQHELWQTWEQNLTTDDRQGRHEH